MIDIPAPRTPLLIRPPERLPVRDADRSWDIGPRLRRLRLTHPLARRRILAHVRAARRRAEAPDLRLGAQDFARRLRSEGLTPGVLAEGFALIDEALFQAYGFRYHDAQMRAGLALVTGHFVEMATGEGKTFTGALPAALHALAGCAVHVVTVNDYLAERDAEEVTPILSLLGLETGHVVHDMDQGQKRDAYRKDVVYCANKELVFDYLRDRAKEPESSPLAYRLRLAEDAGLVVRDLDFVLIDEADSVLIDEANIPLILTEPREDGLSVEFLAQATALAKEADDSFWETPDELGYRSIRSERIRALIAKVKDPAPEWNSLAIAEEMLVQARTAEDRFQRDVHYIVDEEKIVLVDQQTGRPTPDRSLPWGLQQIIELREGLDPSSARDTIGKLSFQSYFRKYHKLVGMSGTLREVRKELIRTYGVPFAAVKTHKPIQRFRAERHIFKTTDDKLTWAAERSKALANAGRAVLLGVSSVSLSERISEKLAALGLVHGLLNARRLDEEADLVAAAGQPGKITVVTNMAGRGTDIKLDAEVKRAGGLHVIILDALETDRLDRQLYGRAGRQGDPGSYDIAHSMDEPELDRLLGKRNSAILRGTGIIPRRLRVALYFALIGRRRQHLERVRRKRRLKLLSGEEKRNDFLVFTRRS